MGKWAGRLKTMTPAEIVITAFGGIVATARAINRDPSTISRWRMPKHQKGSGGSVPTGVQRIILEEARKRGLAITEKDLIWGR